MVLFSGQHIKPVLLFPGLLIKQVLFSWPLIKQTLSSRWLTKPMLLFSGLLIKQMLLFAREDPDTVSLVDNTRGIVFYSVPNKGTPLANTRRAFKYLIAPTVEVEELKQGQYKVILRSCGHQSLWSNRVNEFFLHLYGFEFHYLEG